MSLVNIKKTKDDRVVHLELNFIEKRNILSLEMIQSLTESLTILNEDPKIHLLILSGAGSHFCAGGDLRWMLLDENCPDTQNINEVKMLSKMFNSLYNFNWPVIGSIKGFAFGGALGLVSLCDIAIANTDSQFCFSEIKLALIPAVIAPWAERKMPKSKLRELMLSGRIFKAQEALESNLIHFAGDGAECKVYLEKLKDQLLSYDRTALKQIKRLLNQLEALPKEEIKDYCVQALAERRKSPQARQSIEKFLKSKKKS